MDSLETLSDNPKTERLGSRFAVLVLALQVAAVLAAAFLTTVAVAIVVPDIGDYAKASVLKHERLAQDVPKKIVLVGGSNISYGMDSTLIEETTSCPVTNMGMNGYFGARFMLEEVKPYLREGDIVVITWEYDTFYKSVNGTPTDLLMVTKANPIAFRFLSLEQKVKALARFPFVAQQKAIRAIGDTYDAVSKIFGNEPHPPWTPVDILAIEGASNFTPNGDLVGHIGLTWPIEPVFAEDITNLPMDEDIIPLMQSFIQEMNAEGVHVMISWTPAMDEYYELHRAEIERLNTQLQSIPGFQVPRPASEFVFPPSQHFDTVYHLNAEGRAIRSQMVADDIVTVFGDDAFCEVRP